MFLLRDNFQVPWQLYTYFLSESSSLTASLDNNNTGHFSTADGPQDKETKRQKTNDKETKRQKTKRQRDKRQRDKRTKGQKNKIQKDKNKKG